MKINLAKTRVIIKSQKFGPNTTYMVLGILSFGQELCGYAIRQWALNSLKYFYGAPAQSQIYKELTRLERGGMVSSRMVEQKDKPAKKSYNITKAGLAELRRWLEHAPIDPVTYKNPAALRMFLGHMVSPERMREILLEHRRQVDLALAELEANQVALAQDQKAVFAAQSLAWAMGVQRADMVATNNALSDKK